jgi:hypothetical protein
MRIEVLTTSADRSKADFRFLLLETCHVSEQDERRTLTPPSGLSTFHLVKSRTAEIINEARRQLAVSLGGAHRSHVARQLSVIAIASMGRTRQTGTAHVHAKRAARTISCTISNGLWHERAFHSIEK